MRKSSKERAQKILDNYLETNNHRKTPERYAVLEAVYSMKGHFSLEALRERLEAKHFPVSRATLYNTLKIFINLRLIVCHRLADGTTYEAIEDKENHIHQICTICGQVTELEAPKIAHAIEDTKFRRFTREVFSLYIYGVCSSCKQKTSRL